MQRAIVSFRADEAGEWVAALSCGHRQHVRHRPPFQLRPWVEDAAGRASRVGAPLDCPLCDRAEMPDDLELVRTAGPWDETNLPAGLRRGHRVAAGTWGLLRLQAGRLRFVMEGEHGIEAVLGAGAVQPIPPEIEHRIEPIGAVRVAVDFLAVRRADTGAGDGAPGRADTGPGDEEGGDPACWAGLVCPECGAVIGPDPHRAGCSAATDPGTGTR